MSRKKIRREQDLIADPISWKRLRAIFGDPKLVQNVTQRQFDGFDDKLKVLGRTCHDDIDFGDLWFYHHDLAYQTLQPELFAHLFPVCLMDWHLTLLANQTCSHGDSEFHYGIVHGNVMQAMLTDKQRVQVEQVFRDSMLYRIDQERGLVYDGIRTPTYNRWMGRLNSLAIFSEALPEIWGSWWSLETAGRAVCMMQYCSGLMYMDGENPIFGEWAPKTGGGGPYLGSHDSLIYDRGWSEQNLTFIRDFLTPERVTDGIRTAAEKLRLEPEAKIAAQIAGDLDERQELIKSRIEWLPELLATEDFEGWPI